MTYELIYTFMSAMLALHHAVVKHQLVCYFVFVNVI